MVEQRITSRKNPFLQQVKKLLSSRKAREEAGLFVSDGTKLLEEAVDKINAESPMFKKIRKIIIRKTDFVKNASKKLIRFAPENKDQETRTMYFMSEINQYEVYGKLMTLNADFKDNVYYREIDTDFLYKFYEFIYQYAFCYIPAKDRCVESVFELIRMSIPLGETDCVLIQYLNEEYNQNKTSKRLTKLLPMIEELKPRFTYKNIVDAMKAFFKDRIGKNKTYSIKAFVSSTSKERFFSFLMYVL